MPSYHLNDLFRSRKLSLNESTSGAGVVIKVSHYAQ